MIKRAKISIEEAYKSISNKLVRFESGQYVEYLDDDTLLSVEVEVEDCYNYNRLHLTDVALLRNDKVFLNISNEVFRRLEAEIEDLNQSRYAEYLDWEYQKDYETVGGKYSYY